jgi:hypothetical protein
MCERMHRHRTYCEQCLHDARAVSQQMLMLQTAERPSLGIRTKGPKHGLGMICMYLRHLKGCGCHGVVAEFCSVYVVVPRLDELEPEIGHLLLVRWHACVQSRYAQFEGRKVVL